MCLPLMVFFFFFFFFFFFMGCDYQNRGKYGEGDCTICLGFFFFFFFFMSFPFIDVIPSILYVMQVFFFFFLV